MARAQRVHEGVSRRLAKARAAKPQWSWTTSKGRSASSIESKAEAT
jgi:hypothetical protein